MPKSSSSLSASPASSAWRSALIRSAAGSVRRAAKSSGGRRRSRASARRTARAPRRDRRPEIASDHSRKRSRSAAGMPRSSAITVIGSGNANSPTRSISRAVLTASSSSSAIAWIRGRSCSTIRGVNAFVTRRRSRRWSSPSLFSMWFSIAREVVGHRRRICGELLLARARAQGRARSARRRRASPRRRRSGSGTRSASRRRCRAGSSTGSCSRICA